MAVASCRMAAANVHTLRSLEFPEDFVYNFLPSNNEEVTLPTVDAYSFDEFRMYEFKVRRCTRGRSHDWTECPFAHPGEKARRRDPRKFHYSGTGCPDLRKGSCRRGDACEFAHGVFECWLHPARYRTQPCKDGKSCRRRVCFFAHTAEQLRLLPGSSPAFNNFSHRVMDPCSPSSYDGSPLRFSEVYDRSASSPPFLYKNKVEVGQISSPTSTLVALSPPVSPSGSPPLSLEGSRKWKAAAYYNLMNSLQQMDLNRGSRQESKSGKSPVIINGDQRFSRLQSTPITQDAELRDPFWWGESGTRKSRIPRLGKDVSSVEDGNECPDLSWVNELVM